MSKILDLLKSRKAVRSAKGEATQERKKGRSAPTAKAPWLKFRRTSRAMVAAGVGVAVFFLKEHVPIVDDPELQNLVINSIVAALEFRLLHGVISDHLRLHPDRGV